MVESDVPEKVKKIEAKLEKKYAELEELEEKKYRMLHPISNKRLYEEIERSGMSIEEIARLLEVEL